MAQWLMCMNSYKTANDPNNVILSDIATRCGFTGSAPKQLQVSHCILQASRKSLKGVFLTGRLFAHAQAQSHFDYHFAYFFKRHFFRLPIEGKRHQQLPWRIAEWDLGRWHKVCATEEVEVGICCVLAIGRERLVPFS